MKGYCYDSRPLKGRDNSPARTTSFDPLKGTAINPILPLKGKSIEFGIDCALGFGKIEVDGQTTVTAPRPNATLELIEGTGITLTNDDVNKTITITAAGGAGTGDVVGPASAVDERVAVFDGITGKLIKDGGMTITEILAAVPSVWARTGTVLSPTTAGDSIQSNDIYSDASGTRNIGVSNNYYKDTFTNTLFIAGEEINFYGTSEGKILFSADYTYDGAITLAISLKAIMNAHAADGAEHFKGGAPSPDTVNFPVTEDDATTYETLVTLTNALQWAYSSHASDGADPAPVYHNAQTAFTYQLASAAPVVNLYDIATRLNDIKLHYNQHEADVLGHTVGSQHTETNSDVPWYGFKAQGYWMGYKGLYFSPEDESVTSLGDYYYSWKDIWLKGSADGGTVNFAGTVGGSSYLKSSSDGATLTVGTFTNVVPDTTENCNLGEITTPLIFSNIYSDKNITKRFPVFHVTMWGIVGDGVTDNSTAWATLGAAVVAAGGGTVYFPAGDYVFSTSTYDWSKTNYINFKGEGRVNTHLDFSGAAIHGLYNLGAYGTVEDLSITTQVSKYAINYDWGNLPDLTDSYDFNSIVRNVKINYGIVYARISDALFENILFYRTGAKTGIALYLNGNYSTVDRITAVGYDTGLRVDGSCNCIKNIYSSGNATGLVVNCSHSSFDNIRAQWSTTIDINFVGGVSNVGKNIICNTYTGSPTARFNSLVNFSDDNNITYFTVQKDLITTVNAATYNILPTDSLLHVTYTATAAVTNIQLMTAEVVKGRNLTIKDSGGQAGVNNITITTEGAQTIDGAATAVIAANYGAIKLYSDGSNWFIV